MAVSRWERGTQEPPANVYIQLGNITGDPECWYFWGRAGLHSQDLMRVLPAVHTRLRKDRLPNLQLVEAGVHRVPRNKENRLVAIPVLPVVAATHGGKGDPADVLDQVCPETMLAAPSQWYGHITQSESESRQAVLFIGTVTTSLVLSAFGRRLARCFPLRRAHRMTLGWAARHLTAVIDPGGGSAPRLVFEGEQAESSQVSDVFCQQFLALEDYARWIIDQHLSLAIWPREYVVQDMHLDFQQAKITPLRCSRCRISGLEDFIPDEIKPIDCFVVEGLRVFLDNIYAIRESA